MIYEMNNVVKTENVNSNIKAKSPVVEVFSDMVSGRELRKFDKAVNDKAVEYITGLASRAANDDKTAMAELNEIRRLVVEPRLGQEIKLLGLFGSYKALPWGDTAYLEKVAINDATAKIQAEGTDVSFPFVRKTREPLAPVTISGGFAVNYRQMALGDMTYEYEGMEQVKVQMRNNAARYVIETVYKAVEAAGGIKYFYEAAGLAKTGVDSLLTKIRRYGKPTVIGDYAVLAQFIPWVGYTSTLNAINVSGISEKIMNEINETGLVGSYNGAVLKEMPNGYDFARVNEAGDNYETLLPAGLAFVTPTAPVNGVSPIQTFSIGGLTTFSGNDVQNGEVLSRFDMSVACGVADTSAIGIISDTNLHSL